MNNFLTKENLMPNIEKNIPLPPPRRKNPTDLRAILSLLEVGDSVEVEFDQTAHRNFHPYAKAVKIKITVRTVRPGVARIWRLS